VWHTIDPDGRPVAMELRGWQHILDAHEQLGVGPETILATVASPDRRTRGRALDEEWFYRANAGPSRWIKVVVHYERNRGLIVTAFPRRSFP
jgi:hypothetical protein